MTRLKSSPLLRDRMMSQPASHVGALAAAPPELSTRRRAGGDEDVLVNIQYVFVHLVRNIILVNEASSTRLAVLQMH